jgi:signal transduction histidine kinase/uncharacterized protein YoaH (UPF0181 family)
VIADSKVFGATGLEQAALRRIATLVAEGVQPHELLAVVAEEVARIVDAQSVAVVRFEPDATATVSGTFSSREPLFGAGTRISLDGASVLRLIREHAEPARIDDYSDLEGEVPDAIRRSGMRAAVGVPIVVAGQIWGAIVASNTERLPDQTGARLGEFTELVAAAIANTAAREALARLAEEQAALRRVATLVAQGVPRGELFSAVTKEVARLFAGANPPLVASVIRFDPGPECVLVGASRPYEREPIGSRWEPKELYVSSRVLRDRRPARVDEADLDAVGGPDAEVLRLRRFLYQVGAPVFVEGRLWGAMTLNSTEALPPDTDGRLENFTELVATAIANAESRDALARLAEEQAALRRVATLVARDAPSTEVFDAVATEVAQLLGTDITVVGRYDNDGALTAIGSWSATDAGVPVGTRAAIGGRNVLTIVAETGKPARIDNYDDASGEAAAIARCHGWRSSIAAPISVEGRRWGVMLVATQGLEPFSAGAEEHLAAFTDLVATALANAESRAAAALLADEQAALRRVATLVAHAVQPDVIFSAVGDEIGRLFGSSIAMIGRLEPDAQALVVVGAGRGGLGVPVGSRWKLDDLPVSAQVFRTGRSFRVDEVDWSAVQGGPLAAIVSRLGIVSTVASPIFVEGRLWGVLSVAYDKQLPAETEERLEKFGELIATAIGNAESSAELATSRRRIVAAGDEARRRIERDLHDGIQQRLIALTFHARAMTRKPANELPAIVEELSEGLKDVSDELREIARGIHPTILTEAGLGPALRALARRSDIPIDLNVKLRERLPEPVEAAAYYIASEALTNVAKHAGATVVELTVAHDDDALTLEVRDDGVGGVDPGQGSGILGLTDRVEALAGTITITSPPQTGTTLTVRLPLRT